MSENLKKWLDSLSEQQALAVITASSVNTLSFARSLGRRGVPTLILDSDRHLGIHTRYARVVQLPPADKQPQDWIDMLVFVGDCLKIPGVLFPTADKHCTLISEHAELLRPYFHFLLPDSTVVEQIVNKRLQYDFIESIGVPVPKSYYPESMEAMRQVAAEVSYPCILKPYKSQTDGSLLSGQKLLVINSQAELLGRYGSFLESEVPFLIQEIIPGGDEQLVGYLGLWNAEGNEVAWITKRKLRQFPPGYGNGSLQQSEDLPEVADLSRHILKNLEYRGFVGIEFKYDKRDQTFRLIEINPRSSAMNQLAICSGIDFPWIGYKLLTGQDIAIQSDQLFCVGVQCVNEEWDLQAFFALRKSSGITLWSWLRSVHQSRKIIGAWDDPLPLIMGMFHALDLMIRNTWNAIMTMISHSRDR